MGQAKTVLGQLQALLPRAAWARIVREQRGDWHVHRVGCWSLLTSLIWAQLTQRDSLRDIEVGCEAHGLLLQSLGIASGKRSTLARALRQRPWLIAAGFYHALTQRAARTVPVPARLFSLDVTVIDLCKTAFPWAVFKQGKAGIKLHVLWDHPRRLPTLLNVTPANQREFQTARTLHLPSGSILCCDRGYVDFAWFHRLQERGITVITQGRANWTYTVCERRSCRDQIGVTSDQMVRLTGALSRRKYPGLLRRIRFVDPETKSVWVVMTTNLGLPAATLVALYRRRWDIELFFKWIKRNLKIHTFYGTTYNAVLWQIYAALCVYVLLALLKQWLKLSWSLFRISRAVKEHLLTAIDLQALLAVKSHTAT
jgi:hypothetical protein